MKRKAPLVLVLVFALLAGVQAWAAASLGRNVYEVPVKWTDETGRSELALSEYKGNRLILSLAYRNCKKICPMMTFKKMRDIQTELQKRGESAEFVIVSLDPENDTPAILAEFKKKFPGANEHWHFLTAPEETVKKFATHMNYQYWMYDGHVMHDFRIFDVKPDGNVSKVLNWDNSDIRNLFQ